MSKVRVTLQEQNNMEPGGASGKTTTGGANRPGNKGDGWVELPPA